MRLQVVLSWLFSALIIFAIGCSEQAATNPDISAYNDVAVANSAFPLAGAEDPSIGLPAGPACILNGPGPFLFQALDLTDEQKTQLKDIAVSYREKMEALWSEIRQSGISRETAHEKLMVLRQEMYDEMKSILTDAQRALLAEAEAQLAQGIFPDILIEQRVAYLTELLALDESQQQTLKKIFAEYGAKLLTLRGSTQDFRNLHEQTRTLMNELQDAVINILNEEQSAQYQALIEQHHGHKRHHSRMGPKHPH